MKLFENAENEIQEQKLRSQLAEAQYASLIEFCITNNISLDENQRGDLRNICEEASAPSSDNSAIKDVDFKTEENSRGNDPTIDAAKGDSTQTGGEPCPCHIEDEIEKQQKNDEFVNDYDEDVKKNESANDTSDYISVLEYFISNGVKLDDYQMEALEEQFLCEATDAKKSRKKFIDDIRKKVQKIFEEEGIRMFLQETPNAKKFKNGESDTFNLRFDSESKGVRVFAGIMSGGMSELNRAMYSNGSNASLASQAGINQLIEDCEDDLAAVIEQAGKDNGFDAELVRININGLKVKAVLNEDGYNALKDRNENKRANRIDARENRRDIKKSEKEEERAAKRRR